MADSKEYLANLSRKLADEGKLIEAGWVGLRVTAVPLNASAGQLEAMRGAFFAGAQHLFGSIMTMLEPGTEAETGDLRRLDLIHTELRQFLKEFAEKHHIKAPTEH